MFLTCKKNTTSPKNIYYLKIFLKYCRQFTTTLKVYNWVVTVKEVDVVVNALQPLKQKISLAKILDQFEFGLKI